jgi:CheY-like chemotaxis protein
VDDDAFNLEFLKVEMERILDRKKLPRSLIDICIDGQEAVDTIEESVIRTLDGEGESRAHMYFLVLMDYSMSVLNGDEATKEINTILRNQQIKKIHRPYIVCCSAYEDDDFKQSAKEAGMKEFLTKPVS